MKTAEDLLIEVCSGNYCYKHDVKQKMIEFAKLHVEEALNGVWLSYKESFDEYKEEFLKIYPLEKIK